MAALAWPFSFLPVRGYGARAPRREAESGENGGRVRGYRAWKRGGACASLPAGGIKGGGSYEHLLSWGGYRSKWVCAPLEGGRVVTKLWAAKHSCDRRVGMIERCVHDVNEDICKGKDE